MEESKGAPSDSRRNHTPQNKKLLAWVLGAGLLLALIIAAIWANQNNGSKPIASNAQAVRRDTRSGDISSKVNKAAALDNLKVTVSKITFVTSSAPISNQTNGQLSDQSQETRYLLADVELEGTSKTPVNYSYSQFSVLTDTTTLAAIAPTGLPPGVNTPLGSGSLASGQKISGQVMMHLPAKYTYFYVVFTPTEGISKRIVIGQ